MLCNWVCPSQFSEQAAERFCHDHLVDFLSCRHSPICFVTAPMRFKFWMLFWFFCAAGQAKQHVACQICKERCSHGLVQTMNGSSADCGFGLDWCKCPFTCHAPFGAHSTISTLWWTMCAPSFKNSSCAPSSVFDLVLFDACTEAINLNTICSSSCCLNHPGRMNHMHTQMDTCTRTNMFMCPVGLLFISFHLVWSLGCTQRCTRDKLWQASHDMIHLLHFSHNQSITSARP